ncbi:hypothetical protein LEMLEM_LOCUS9887 [Lemmus lemmus]
MRAFWSRRRFLKAQSSRMKKVEATVEAMVVHGEAEFTPGSSTSGHLAGKNQGVSAVRTRTRQTSAKDQEHRIDNNQNVGVLGLFESSSLISPQVEKESSPMEPAPIVLKKTDPEERKEFVPNDLEESAPKDAKECGPKELRVFAQRSQRSSASTLWMCWWITC